MPINRPHILSLLFLSSSLLSGSDEAFEQFKNSQEQEFAQKKTHFIDYKKAEEAAFAQHLENERREIAAYTKKIEQYWPKAELGNPQKLVTYSDDLKTQRIIDFQNNTLSISQISPEDSDAKEKLLQNLDATLSLDNTQAFNENELEQNINKISQTTPFIKHAELDGQKLLDKTEAAPQNISIVKNEKGYQLTYTLPKDATFKRSSSYLVPAKANAKRFNLKAQWLLAIMHTESSFNPLARSHIPAYGLMQIVPKSAGIDSYYFLYNERRLLSASYLYNTHKNIETGSAYLHILYYKYLASIKNPTSRLYCAIAGYNTGAGNVARAFVGTNSVPKAAEIINTMSPESVYAYLLKNLRYDEPKHYLKRVRERTLSYEELYQL